MNKLFTKIATFSVGLALAVGVGVAASSSKAGEAKAASGPEISGYTQATSVEDVTSHASGKFLIAAVTSSETYFLTNGATSAGRIDGVASGSITVADCEFDIVYDSTSVSGKEGYSIKGATKYYSWSSSTSISVQNSVSSDKDLWTIAMQDGRFRITNVNTTTRAIVFRAGTANQFGAYATSNINNTEYFDVEIYYANGSPTPVTSYSVTGNVTHGSVSPSSVNEGATLNATITPDSGYNVPESVTVTMGGQAVTPTYSNGVVTVANVTGAIVISGVCPEKPAPQPTDLPEGVYTAVLDYAVNPSPDSFDVKNANNKVVAQMAASLTGVTADTKNNDWVIAANGDGNVTITNPTNAKFTQITLDIFRYDNFTVKADGADVHVGTNDNLGNRVTFDIAITGDYHESIVITSNNNYTSKLYAVTVYMQVGSASVPVTGVSLPASEGKLAVGATRTLTPSVLPANATNKAVTWSSSAPAVASVSDSGVVTGVAAGDAVITVTTADGGFTATYSVHVAVPNYGSADNPLTVEEAREALEYTDSATTSSKLYVVGKVSSSSWSGETYDDYTVWLSSSDESESNYFEIYGGTIANAITEDDHAANALAGETIISVGYGKIHNGSTYELCKANNEKPTIEKYEEPVPVVEYDVTYEEGQASHGTKVAAGTEITIAQPTQAAPEGKAFDCWVANDHEYQPGDPYVVNASVTFVAQYVDVVVEYTVTYQEGSNSYSSKVVDGTKITIASPKDEAPEHYEFTCWRVNSTDYQPGAEYTVTGNVTFVAIYSKIPPVLESIEVTTLPTKVEYYPNEEFESAGIVVTATYDYGDPVDVTEDVEFSGFDSSVLGEVTVTVTYLTESTTFTVTIVKAPITDWEPEQKEAFMDVVGKELPFINADFVEELEQTEDSSGAYFQAYVVGDYLNDVLAALNSWDYTTYDADQECYYVTDPCGEGRAVVQVGEMYGYTILFYFADPYNGIVVVDGDFDYYVGDSLDISSLEMYVTNKSVSDGGYLPGSVCDFSVTKFETAGVIEVTVTYGYYYGTFEVEVTPVLPVSLELDVSGAKTTYKVDDEFESAGLVARLVNNNGSKVDVSSDVTISGFDTSSVGEREVTVSYGNFSASYIITVVPKYDADAFAAQFLSEISRVCSGYDGKSSNKEALKSVWATMKQNYNSLTPEEKMRVIKAEAKTGGSELEQVMAFYDYACRKYGLEKFVENRSIKAMVFEEQTPNNNLPIIFIVASSIAAVTLIGVVIAYARRRRLYVK